MQDSYVGLNHRGNKQMIDLQKDYLLGKLEKANTGCVVVVKTETEWCNYVVQNSAFLMKCLWLCGTCTCENNIHYHHLHLPPFKQNTKLDLFYLFSKVSM